LNSLATDGPSGYNIAPELQDGLFHAIT